MTIKDIALVVGTRPQIIKSYPLVKSLRRHGFRVDIVNTGQHYDYGLAEVLFDNFDMKPVKNLNVGPGTLNFQLSRAISKLEAFLHKTKFDLVVAPGDTTSTLAAALAAVKSGTKLAHLEAGGRGIHTKMQEEINRRLIDHSSDILFAPLQSWTTNLKDESVHGDIYFVGDTMYDLFLERQKLIRTRRDYANKILVTIHRAENIADKKSLTRVCDFVNSLGLTGLDSVFPVHPHTKQKLDKFGLHLDAKLIDPVDHAEMMNLVEQSSLVVTDSGGLQKEAYWASRPCIAIHKTFEWRELVDERANFPIHLDRPVSIAMVKRILKTRVTPKPSIFGAGCASERISEILKTCY